MEFLIWGGAVFSIFGLLGLIMSIVIVVKARKKNLTDDELRNTVQKAMPLNMGSLFVSVIGLMAVILGIFLS